MYIYLCFDLGLLYIFKLSSEADITLRREIISDPLKIQTFHTNGFPYYLVYASAKWQKRSKLYQILHLLLNQMMEKQQIFSESGECYIYLYFV